MIKWSPISRVFSMEPEGMTRACPIVPLIRRNASPTQNHAMTSRLILVFTGRFASSCVFFLSAFTFHHHRPLCGPGLTAVALRRLGGFAIQRAFAHLKLHQIRRVNSRIARRAKLAFGVADRQPKSRHRNVSKRIGAKEFADFL